MKENEAFEPREAGLLGPIGQVLDSARVLELIEKPRLIGAFRSHRRGGGTFSIKP